MDIVVTDLRVPQLGGLELPEAHRPESTEHICNGILTQYGTIGETGP